jgi:hypothetical protein
MKEQKVSGNSLLFLERSVEGKKIIWFPTNNHYMLVEIPAYTILCRLINGDGLKNTAEWCSNFYDLPKSEATRFVHEIQEMIKIQSTPVAKKGDFNLLIHKEPDFSKFFSRKFYLLNGLKYQTDFETEELEYLIHPKFAHLEADVNKPADHHFQVFCNHGNYILKVNGTIIGEWPPEDAHFLSGKFSMELVNHLYGKTESDWMAVFHASAIRNANRCILFLGDSGSGKSTAAAVLMESGFDLLADDFVPVDAASGEVNFFPAAVSVKKNALDHLIPIYPQLASATEFYFPGMNKTVRYLPPLTDAENNMSGTSCNALVFIKYEKDSGLKLEQLKKDVAFQKLVPDSWISPLPENATRFLDWFIEMPCYQLTYSNNEMMVKTVKKLFEE